MPTPIETLEAEVLHLGAADRARLLERLIASFDVDPEIEEAWLDEALRREAAAAAGEVVLVPGHEALARVQARLA